MSASFTRGTWVATRCGPGRPTCWNVISELGENERGIRTIRTIDQVLDYCGAEEAEANARLIAAAPRMYAALETVERIITSEPFFSTDPELIELCDEVNSALAQARGGDLG